MCEDDKNIKGDEDMAVKEEIKIDINKSIFESVNEVKKIRDGKSPKRSYKEMLKDIREEISDPTD